MNGDLNNAIQSSDLTCAEKLKILADRTRLAVMETLMEEPCHVGRLAEILDVEQSLLSHHLRVLREAGLVVGTREGKTVLYRVAPTTQVSGSHSAINLGCCRLHFEPGQRRMKQS
jgi:ArsR family transcriptional regulator